MILPKGAIIKVSKGKTYRDVIPDKFVSEKQKKLIEAHNQRVASAKKKADTGIKKSAGPVSGVSDKK